MTPEKQRIAIAEACGWHVIYDKLPNYLNDLNAIHEAEKTLNNDQLLRYHGMLLNMCGRSMYASMAQAAQRAEAFLKTTGKWEEGTDEYNSYTVVDGVKLYDSDDIK